MAALVFLFSKPVMTQIQSYHLFVDTRNIFGVPNTFDVISNFFFAVTGFLGVMEVRKQPALITKNSWLWFFISIFLIAPGSAYYHWAPTDATLVWDRLPMSMGFMALYVALLTEHSPKSFEKYLPVALIIGIASVVVWAVTGDLRFYFWVQFSSFLTIPLILILFTSHYTLKIYYVLTLVFYGLAKWAEVKDPEVFAATGGIMSGHTLKHLLAAMALLSLWWMIKVRKKAA